MARSEWLKGDPKVGLVKVYQLVPILTRTPGPKVGLYKARSGIKWWSSEKLEPLIPPCVNWGPLGPLGFECSQHRQTLRPSVDGVRSKALRPAAPPLNTQRAWLQGDARDSQGASQRPWSTTPTSESKLGP